MSVFLCRKREAECAFTCDASHEQVFTILDVFVAVVVAQLCPAADLRHRVEHNSAAAVCNHNQAVNIEPVDYK